MGNMGKDAIFALCLVVALAVIMGCQKFQGAYTGQALTMHSANTSMGGINASEYNRDIPLIQPLDLDRGSFPNSSACNENNQTTAFAAASMNRTCRNRLAEHLIGLSGNMCAQHKVQIQSNAAFFNFSFSGASSILGGVGALVSGETAARILSGSAGMTTALHSNLNENVYQNQLSSAILTKIDSLRKAKLNDMRGHFNDDISAYPADRMLADANEYNNLCSFSEALANLGNDSRRPLTTDEIRGQIRMLTAEVHSNDKELAVQGLDPGAANILKANNRLLLTKIGNLQSSLASEVSSQNASAAQPTGGTKQE